MVELKGFPAVLFYAILWRLVSVFVVQTAHVPDEYWQSVEVAHRLSFGYGYLTWEWREGIRSHIYPFLISIVYRILKFIHLDYVSLLTTMPCVLQALLSAYADYRFYIWTRNKWALFTLCTNWYWYYCAPRTLLNTLETSLTTIALSIFPWRDSGSRSIRYLWIVAFLCSIRPTAAVIWTPLCLYHVFTATTSRVVLLFRYAGIGIIVLATSTLVDSICHGDFVITPLEFLKANIFNQVGSFYGSEPLLWYFFAGMPVLLGVHCLTFATGAWKALRHPAKFHRQVVMLVAIGWTVAVYSSIDHKEFRFILPLLPLFTCLSAQGIFLLNSALSPLKRKSLMVIIALSNLLPGIYFCLIHQRGSLDVMKILHRETVDARYYDVDILFLTPCHATPFYSHLHSNVTMRFLTCEPNLKGMVDYVDEAAEFFATPMLWLNKNYLEAKDTQLPSHVVLFDKLAPDILKFLDQYEQIAKLFYAHFTQGSYSRYILLYRRKL